MQETEASRLGELVLAWLLTQKEGKGPRSGVARALQPFTSHRWTNGEFGARLDESLEALASKGHIQLSARGGLTLTAEGRAQALRWLGVERTPKGLTWAKLKASYLVARALGAPKAAASQGQIGTAQGLRASLLQRRYGQLGEPGSRTLAQVVDALCWRQLGVESSRPFTLPNVRSFLLARLMQSSRELPPQKAVEQLAALAAGARRPEPEELRVALLGAWLLPDTAAPAGSDEQKAGTRAQTVAEEVKSLSQEGLEGFAARVLEAARASRTGRFGDNKVFISHVWRALQGQGLDEEVFRQRLLEANRVRLLSLSRADLVEAMDPEDVAASETRYLGASFHFVNV